ncbi:MAG TPA: GNAT family N-acetyltransferase, partial [Nitrososphaera sp.]|nr:GNAT family N-acetyltransferase [Nitrososphaera sp.]
MLALKQLCTTQENLYDRPTTSEMRRLFTPLLALPARTTENPSQAVALRGLPSEDRERALTQYLTALWENADGKLVGYALLAQPGTSLTFQVHPQAQGQGIEAKMLAWGLAQAQLIAQTRGAH